MLDSIGKDFGTTSTVWERVLLGAEDDSLRAVDTIETINDGIKTAQLLKLLCLNVEEVLLHWRLWTDSRHDDTSFLVMVALPIELTKNFSGCLYDGSSGVGGCQQTLLQKVPILWEVFAKGVGMKEHSYDACYCALLPQFLRTTARIVADMGAEGVEIGYHSIETPAGTDAFLLRQLFVGDDILAIELLPGADDIDIVERQSYPILMMLGEVISRLDS